MQTVSLLFCIMIAVAAADDAAAHAAGADVDRAADAGADAAARDAAAHAADKAAAGADAAARDAAARAADAADRADAGAADKADAGADAAVRDAAAGADAAARDAAAGADAAALDAAAREADAAADAAARAAAADRSAVAPTCSNGWSEFEGRCFKYVPRPLTWASAEKNCKNVKSHLASVHNHHEYQFIQTMIRSTTQADVEAWIGGSDCPQKDTWLWSDGSVFFWTFWCAGQRNSAGCLQMNHGGENCWDEEACSSKLPSVCAHDL